MAETQKNSFLNSISSSLDAVLREEYDNLKISRSYLYPLSEPTYDKAEILNSLDSLLSFNTTMGKKVRQFEELFAKEFGGEAIMVNSGSSADLLISLALNEKYGGPLRDGSEVLVPAVTWPTQIWSLLMAGFKVRLIDINLTNLNLSEDYFENAINEKTSALFVVNLLGNSANMDRVKSICDQNNLLLFEDCCESFGSKWKNRYLGTFGIASSFSFFFSHHLVTMEGGMIFTVDKQLADRIRLLRAHGWSRAINNKLPISIPFNERYEFVSQGLNVRPTEIQGAFGISQWQKRKIFENQRNIIAKKLQAITENSQGWLSTMQVSSNSHVSWFAFPILISQQAPFSRDEIINYLELKKIETRPIIAGNLAQQPAVKSSNEVTYSKLPNADFVNENGFYIGINPVTSDDVIEKVVNIFIDFIEQKS